MWFLSFVPDWLLTWLIHGAVIVGLFLTFGGSLLKNVPIINSYAQFANTIGGILLLIGVYFEGGLGVEMSYRAKIADLQAKVKIAEQQSKEANAAIEQRVAERVKNIKDNVNVKAKGIEANRASINAECKLSDVAWMWYNRASQNDMAGGTTKFNGTSK
jgi:hypothetical protein